ncbi:MAG: hypothetical protein WD358_06525 [Nitriliruptoraceae bacterium]
MRKAFTVMAMATALMLSALAPAIASSTIVPGHQTDDGSIPEGTVNGRYTALYAWDANGDWYFDLGDGREQGTVGSVDELDDSTLTVCDYVVVYRGDFEGTPFLANGWIRNNIRCSGYAYSRTQTFNTLYVHETDHRWSEDLEPIWGTWGIAVDAVGGVGNVANPQHPVNQ